MPLRGLRGLSGGSPMLLLADEKALLLGAGLKEARLGSPQERGEFWGQGGGACVRGLDGLVGCSS